jgi:hypothetical protein
MTFILIKEEYYTQDTINSPTIVKLTPFLHVAFQKYGVQNII